MKNKRNTNKWSVPENAEDYFDPHYDDAFKAKHPILYFLTIVAIIILVLVGPITCICICGAIKLDINGFFELILLLVGFIASFGISIGFCNLFMIVHKQYLGHYVTIFSFLIGFLGAGGSLLILWLINR